MSDFDQFESAQTEQTEEDPAAEFLAREQDDLAALEGDEFVSSEPAATETVENDFAADGFEAAQDPEMSNPDPSADIFDPLADAVSSITLSADVPSADAFSDPSDGVQFESAQQDGEPGEESSDLYTAIKQVDTQRAEPEKIRLWRENQAEMLIKKDEQSEEKKAEWREVAKKELEDWYKHRDEQLEKAAASNQEGEAIFITERDESIPGHEWERICRLCDFNPKASRTSKDISRMRSILLQLKQSPIQRS